LLSATLQSFAHHVIAQFIRRGVLLKQGEPGLLILNDFQTAPQQIGYGLAEFFLARLAQPARPSIKILRDIHIKFHIEKNLRRLLPNRQVLSQRRAGIFVIMVRLPTIISVDFPVVSAFFLILRQKPGCVPVKIGDCSIPHRLEVDRVWPEAGSGASPGIQQSSPDPAIDPCAREDFSPFQPAHFSTAPVIYHEKGRTSHP
jgi:hypothetical protein